MSYTVSQHTINELAQADSKNEILLLVTDNTELHITKQADGKTIITFPFGNKFEIINNRIIVHEKKS